MSIIQLMKKKTRLIKFELNHEFVSSLFFLKIKHLMFDNFNWLKFCDFFVYKIIFVFFASIILSKKKIQKILCPKNIFKKVFEKCIQ